MDNILPDNLNALFSLSQLQCEKTKDDLHLACRKITRTNEERELQERKYISALEEILAKKQRFTSDN